MRKRRERHPGLSWALGDLELIALELPKPTKERLIQAWGTAEVCEAFQQGEPRQGRTYHITWGGKPTAIRAMRGVARHPLIELEDDKDFFT